MRFVQPSPFTPSFGTTPPLLVGRDDLRVAFAEALDYGFGSPDRATLYTGARGVGKTVMLNAVEDDARRRGWEVISETATQGMTARIRDTHLPQLLAPFSSGRTRLTGVTVPMNMGGATWEATDPATPVETLRTRLTTLADVLAEQRRGVLITVDEIHAVSTEEMKELGTVVQHAFREGREVAFAGAGLATSISELLNEDVLTFLRRAEKHSLGKVSRTDVETALRSPIEAAGRTVSDEALTVMVDATEGYPFLVQLVGHRSWIAAGADDGIGLNAAAEGVATARRRLGSLVHEPALSSCSSIDKTFLAAMARDEGSSQIADIAARMGVDGSYANMYRSRLIAQELIAPVGWGRVAFVLPGLRQYLTEHAVTDVDW